MHRSTPVLVIVAVLASTGAACRNDSLDRSARRSPAQGRIRSDSTPGTAGRAPAEGSDSSSAGPGATPAHAVTAADPREGAGVAAADAKSQPVHPVMPQRLVSAVRSATQIELSWTASTEPPPVAGYEVFRDDRLTATVRDPHFIDGGLRPWTRFCYSVRSYDAAGQRSPRTPISCVQTPDEAPPSEPDQITVTGRGPGEALLAWQASTDDVAVTGYEITRDGKVTATIHETTFVDKGLNAVVEHCYVV